MFIEHTKIGCLIDMSEIPPGSRIKPQKSGTKRVFNMKTRFFLKVSGCSFCGFTKRSFLGS